MNLTNFFVIFFGIIIGCANVGNNFNQKEVAKIQIGSTKKEDIRKLFGNPFRTGIENGREIWVYEYNSYSSFRQGSFKDLIIVFNRRGIVDSHQIMSNLP